jgi:hypothetical protein
VANKDVLNEIGVVTDLVDVHCDVHLSEIMRNTRCIIGDVDNLQLAGKFFFDIKGPFVRFVTEDVRFDGEQTIRFAICRWL